jgi:hypothetical protein
MTCTFWSNAGKHEWIISDGDKIVHRSGLIFKSKSAAKTDMEKFVETM